ncbi:MAG: hypothetical protein HY815_15760 [Candidatus Riflebacteria bacterium]|nr:hypothetical protein [Candidatus Riflebacteria bacterium]
MTAYVSLALFAEGTTDHLFLHPLLIRTTEDLCRRHARGAVHLADGVIELHPPTRFKRSPLHMRVLEAAREALGAFNILVIYTTGDIFESNAQTLVNPVNCVGVGRGWRLP